MSNNFLGEPEIKKENSENLDFIGVNFYRPVFLYGVQIVPLKSQIYYFILTNSNLNKTKFMLKYLSMEITSLKAKLLQLFVFHLIYLEYRNNFFFFL